MSFSNLTKRKHHLPHWQMGGSVYFVTFRSAIGELSEDARYQVKHTILYGHEFKFCLYFGVIMPDHVHLLLQPLNLSETEWFDLGSILKMIKGTSGRRINDMTHRTGKVWQAESFDRIIRDDQEFIEKSNYMLNNPVKAGLVERIEEYPFFIQPEQAK